MRGERSRRYVKKEEGGEDTEAPSIDAGPWTAD
jgi:hypothetical protein